MPRLVRPLVLALWIAIVSSSSSSAVVTLIDDGRFCRLDSSPQVVPAPFQPFNYGTGGWLSQNSVVGLSEMYGNGTAFTIGPDLLAERCRFEIEFSTDEAIPVQLSGLVEIHGTGAASFDYAPAARATIEQNGSVVLGDDFVGFGTPDGSSAESPFSYAGMLDPGTYTVIVDALPQTSSGNAYGYWEFEFVLGDPPPGPSTEMDWVTVGSPGNACDPQPQGCFGAVEYEFRIGRFEVTNFQYAEFLNAVAATDNYGLLPTPPSVLHPAVPAGIIRSGAPGSYSYQAAPGRETFPVEVIGFAQALRFANWLHNGKPTGSQDGTTTEDGAYTITAEGLANNSISRNPGATVFIPSEDEWFKAAYYDPALALYYDYPTGTDAATTCSDVSTPIPNRANCYSSAPTPVGSYPGSPSPFGTFDQAANAGEVTDTILGSGRAERGGSWFSWPPYLAFAADYREGGGSSFRVASLPAAPAVPSSGPAAGVALALAIAVVGGWRFRALRSAGGAREAEGEDG